MAFDDYQSSVIPGTVRYGLSPGSMTNGNKTQLEDGEFFFIVHSDGLFTLLGSVQGKGLAKQETMDLSPCLCLGPVNISA